MNVICAILLDRGDIHALLNPSKIQQETRSPLANAMNGGCPNRVRARSHAPLEGKPQRTASKGIGGLWLWGNGFVKSYRGSWGLS